MGVSAGQEENEGWAAIESLFSPSPECQARRQELQLTLNEFDYSVNCHGVEVGQRYTSGALADDGTLMPEHRRDEQLFYEPTTHPGAYLPHPRLEPNSRVLTSLTLVHAPSWP